jgi:hypothetical protein
MAVATARAAAEARRPRHPEGGVSAWKSLERRVAVELGGIRAWATPGSDIDNTPYSVEVKRCKRYALRSTWLEQARRQSREDGKPWILVVAEHGDRNPVVVQDFKTWAARERAA